MNIEYRQADIDALNSKRREIHAQTIIARDATEKVLKFTQEMAQMHTEIATRHYQNSLPAK